VLATEENSPASMGIAAQAVPSPIAVPIVTSTTPSFKKSAAPIFRHMLASHERSLLTARDHSEPAGQIAAREMEIVRIKGALQRVEELGDDVATGIERVSL
jgi:hypothetical protein